MSGGIVETGIASASGSILAYGLLSCWRHHRDRTRVFGLVMSAGKTYAEKHFNGLAEKVIFFDIDGAISTRPLRDIPKNELALDIYPKAKLKVAEIKKTHKNKIIVFCSSDKQLLKFSNVKQKQMKAIIFSKSFASQYGEQLKDRIVDLDKARMELELQFQDEKQRVYINSWDDLSNKMVNDFVEKMK